MPLIKILTRTICDKKDVAVGAVVDASPTAANILIKLGKATPFAGKPEPAPKPETIAEAEKPKRTKKTSRKPQEG